MQSTKHSPFVVPFSNFNRNQVSKRNTASNGDSYPAKNTESNKENRHPYSDAEQVSQVDPYHPDSSPNKKKVHPYLPPDVKIPSNVYGLFIPSIQTETNADNLRIDSTDPSAQDDLLFPCSLNIHRQRDLLKRPGKNGILSSPNTKQSGAQDVHSTLSPTQQQRDLAKRPRTVEYEHDKTITKRQRYQNYQPAREAIASPDQKKSLHQNDCLVPASKKHPDDFRKKPLNNWSKLLGKLGRGSTRDNVRATRKEKRSRCLTRAKESRPKARYRTGSGYQRSNFLCQSPGSKWGYAPSLLSSPDSKLALRSRLGSPVKLVLNKYGSPTKGVTKGGQILKRSAKTDRGYTFTSTAVKPKHHRCKYDKANASQTIQPKFAPLTRLQGSILLNEGRLDDFLGARHSWSTTQRTVMKMSAADAARAAGVGVKGEFHWLHLFAFSMGGHDGVEPNEEQNFVLGTAGANGFHLRMEDTVKELVRKYGEVEVRYSIDPKQNEFDAKWHLCGCFTYEFWVKGKRVDAITIDTLDTRFPSLTDNTCFTAFGEVAIQREAEKENNAIDHNKAKPVQRQISFSEIGKEVG